MSESPKAGKQDFLVGRFKLDSSAKPKAIDVILDPGKATELTLRGVYELDGDTLKLCWPAPDAADTSRPTEFKSPTGKDLWLLTLKRAAKAGKR